MKPRCGTFRVFAIKFFYGRTRYNLFCHTPIRFIYVGKVELTKLWHNSFAKLHDKSDSLHSTCTKIVEKDVYEVNKQFVQPQLSNRFVSIVLYKGVIFHYEKVKIYSL